MSPRRKRVPDAQIVDAASRVVAERGAAQTRLSDVAAATGFAAATLVQRFGSREGLLHAVADAHIAAIIDAFEARSALGHSLSHLDRITSGLQRLHVDGHITFLLAHSDSAPSYSLELRKQIAFGLAAAVESGELPHCDISSQARRIQIAYYGLAAATLLERDESVASAIGSVVREVLADFL